MDTITLAAKVEADRRTAGITPAKLANSAAIAPARMTDLLAGRVEYTVAELASVARHFRKSTSDYLVAALDDVNSLEQVAAYLKYEPVKVRRLSTQRKIAHTLEGHTLTFTREAVLAYVAANTIPATPPPAHGLTERGAARIRGRAA